VIEIIWQEIKDDKDPLWKYQGCLYVYITIDYKEILLIGKAWGCTVKHRWNASDKQGFWCDLEKHKEIFEHRVLVGILNMSQRLTKQLLLDIETLLIKEEKPWGNIQAKKSRISRPEMVVVCKGLWPGKQKRYIDEG
jgi:hypothetical protein